MTEQIKQRIYKFQNDIGLTVAGLAKKIGMPQPTVNNYFLGNRDISLKLVVGILNAFPTLSADWLLRGVGEMYRKTDIDTFSEMVIAKHEKEKEAEKLTEEIARLKEENETLQKNVSKLIRFNKAVEDGTIIS